MANIKWDDESQGSITWDDSQIQWDDEQPSFASQAVKKVGEGAVGTAAGLIDLAYGIPKFLAGTTLAAGATAAGERPDIAREAAHGAMEETFPGLGSVFPSLQDNLGYQVWTKPFELLNQGIDWVGEQISDDPAKQGLAKQAIDIGLIATPARRSPRLKTKPERTEGRAMDYEYEPSVGRETRESGVTIERGPDGRVLRVIDKEGKVLDYSDLPAKGSREPSLGKQIEIEVPKSRQEPSLRGYPEKELPQERPEPSYGKEVDIIERPEPPLEPPPTKEQVFEKRQRPKEVEPLPFEMGLETKEQEAARLATTQERLYQERVLPESAEGITWQQYELVPEAVSRDPIITRMNKEIREQDKYVQAKERELSELYLENADLVEGRMRLPEDKSLEVVRLKEHIVKQSEILERYKVELEARLAERYGYRSPEETPYQQSVYEARRPTAKGDIGTGDFTGPRSLELTSQHPMGRQRGAIDPVFSEATEKAIGKVIDFITKEGKKLRISILKGFPMEYGTDKFFDTIPEPKKPPEFTIVARDEKGKPVGYVAVDENPMVMPGQSSTARVRQAWVSAGERRKGIASAMYDVLDSIGVRRQISSDLSPEGQAFTSYRRKQTGAINIPEIGKQLSKVFSRASKKETQREPGVVDKPSEKSVRDFYRNIKDTRTVDEFIKDELLDATKWRDIDPLWTEKIGGNFLPGSNIASLARNMPVIKWVVDHTLDVDRIARVRKEAAKYGDTFARRKYFFKGKWEHRVKDESGALTLFEKMSKKDQEHAAKVWAEKYDGRDIPMTLESLLGDGLSEKQAKGILSAREQLKNFLNRYNSLAAKFDITPIKEIPNYFPHMWFKDFVVIMKNAEGKTVRVLGADTMKQAKVISADMQKQFPDHQFEPKERGRTKYDINNLQAFREALGILDETDPLYNKISFVYQHILTHRGFQRQTLFRSGVEGFSTDIVKVLDTYFDKGYNFLANQEKKANWAEMMKGLKDNGIKFDKQYQSANDYINAFIDNSRNAVENLAQVVDSVLEEIGKQVPRFGKNAARNLLSEANGLASANWLSTPKFFLAQLMQPLYNLPKGFQLKAAGLTEEAIIKEFGNAQYEAFFKPTKKTVEDVNWAKRNGYIDAKILDLMGTRLFAGQVKNPLQYWKKGVRWGLGKVEQSAVRTPAFIFYNNLLKDTPLTREQRLGMAGSLTDKYMVDYTTTDAPLIYGKLGIIGEAARPLKQYSHAYYGQMIEYLQSIKHEKSAKPLASFLAVQAFVSGAKGFIGLSEAAAIILAINAAFGLMWPTPEEYMITHGVSDLVLFGGVSTITGLDVSGSLSAPQLGQFTTLPGVEFGYQAAKELGTYGLETIQDKETEASEMRALQSIAPTTFQGAIEEAYTKPGQGPPNPKNRMIPDLSARNSEDVMARWAGGRSLGESREMIAQRNLRRVNAIEKEQRKKAMDLIVDRIAEGKWKKMSKQDKQEKRQAWIKRGGDPEMFADEILSQMKARSMDYAKRYVGSLDISDARKIKRLRDFELIIEKEQDIEVMSEILENIRSKQNAR